MSTTATESIVLEKILSTNLLSGLKTTLLYERKPFAARVSWINWDSGFRDSGLEIEDLIVAVNGVPLALPEEQRARQNYTPKIIGQYSEYNGFAEAGLSDGATITLGVLRKIKPGRGYQTLEITGRLRAERVYYNAAGKNALAPGGPEGLGRDGTDEAWTSWYSKRLWDWERFVDERWLQSLSNRMEFTNHQAHKERVALALQKFPGEFSKRLKEDFDKVARCLQGALSPLPPDALEFREANARREKDVVTAGDQAWAAYLEKNKTELLDKLPTLDLIRDDRSALTGKLVVLTGLSWRQAVADGDRSIITGQHSGHWCFMVTDQAPLRKFQKISARYKTKVSPRTSESFDLIGRLAAQTRMVVTRSGTAIGFDLEAMALRVSGNFFIDLSAETFAGEDTLKIADLTMPSAQASPTDIMRTLVTAVKDGNAEVWKSLYADWTAMGGDGDAPYYRPFNPYNTWDSDWNRARNVILNKALHVEPLWESEPKVIMTGKEFEGAPKIEQVMVEMNHINRFDDGDRVFSSVDVRRVWILQRRDGGPWKIASRNTI